jgi:hypothetical protein
MKYIQNVHTAPITAVVKNAKGEVILTKKFSPAKTERFTGRIEATGYTSLTDEEYRLLNEGSKTFTVYRDKHELLVEHDELPPEAKTPHDALVDARKESRKSAAQIAELNGEIVKLKADLLDAERKYKDLFDASGDVAASAELAKEIEFAKQAHTEMVTAKDAIITDLQKEKGALEASLADMAKERDALKAAAEKAGKSEKGKGKEKEFE